MAEVNRKKRVNGQREISLIMHMDDINDNFLRDIEFGWKIDFKDELYTITNPVYSVDGDTFNVGVDAVLSFFVDMNNQYMQDEIDEPKLVNSSKFFADVFEDSGYTWAWRMHRGTRTMSYPPNQTRTERFLYGLEVYKSEYVINGSEAYITDLRGEDRQVILHEDLNVKDVSIEVDASAFHTWAKGFGDKIDSPEEGEPEGYQIETRWPPKWHHNNAMVDKHGWLEGPAIYDGNLKTEFDIEKAISEQVENSYTISTSISAIDLSNNGYPDFYLEEGDRIFLYVTDLKQNEQVRVVEIDETFDEYGDILDVNYTLGNEGLSKTYKTQQYNSTSEVKSLVTGRAPIAFDWLPGSVRRVMDIVNGNINPGMKIYPGRVETHNRGNSLQRMRLNDKGLQVTTNGGTSYKTIIGFNGIIQDLIITGVISGVTIKDSKILSSSTDKGSLIVENGAARSTKSGKASELSKGVLSLEGPGDNVEIDNKGWSGRTMNVGNTAKVASTANGMRIGVDVSDTGTYIYMNASGEAGFVHNGVVYQSFTP